MLAIRRAIRTPCFDLLRAERVGKPEDGRQARLGMVIPKRLARQAVLRNLIKRQVREVFRHQCQSLPEADLVVRLSRWPMDFAAMGKTSPALKQTLRRELEVLLDKLRQQVSKGESQGILG